MAVEAAVRWKEKQRMAAAPRAPGTRRWMRRRGTCEFEAWASDLKKILACDISNFSFCIEDSSNRLHSWHLARI